ncbi:19055_t:CDS:2, partial [Racocetra persica]
MSLELSKVMRDDQVITSKGVLTTVRMQVTGHAVEDQATSREY